MLKQLSYGVATCPFALDGYDDDSYADSGSGWTHITRDCDRTSRSGQAGNAMHVQCVGVVLAYVLSHGNTKVDIIRKRGLYGKLVSSLSSAANVDAATGAASSGLSTRMRGLALMIRGPSQLRSRKAV